MILLMAAAFSHVSGEGREVSAGCSVQLQSRGRLLTVVTIHPLFTNTSQRMLTCLVTC